MDLDDKDLFRSAMTDEPTEIVADTPAEAPAPEQPQQDGRPRDEHGRFAPRQAQEAPATPQPEPQAQDTPAAKEEAHIPSWRVREIREEAARQMAEREAQWQRQYEALQRQAQPRTPEPEIDPYVDPQRFRDEGIRQHVSPIQQEIQLMREEFSYQRAEDKHGAEKVRDAYQWIKQGMSQRDPEVISAYQRAMQSRHPFGEIVEAHGKRTVFQTVGNDPNAWFEKELERRMTSDPAFAAKVSQGRQQSNPAPQGNNIRMPPSLRSVPAARGAVDDDSNDMSDAALFRHAMR